MGRPDASELSLVLDRVRPSVVIRRSYRGF
jgi:hypothetical protein